MYLMCVLTTSSLGEEEDVSPEFRKAWNSFLELSLFHLGSKSFIAGSPAGSALTGKLQACGSRPVMAISCPTREEHHLVTLKPLQILSFWALQAGWKWHRHISQVAASPTHRHVCVLLSSPPTVLWKGDLADWNSCKQIYHSLPGTVLIASFISLHSLVHNTDLWIKQWRAESAG